ncbi:MAG: SIS domain-containing protein [Gemmatimonadota bacterium]|jgi:D-sedoheptulose 7-phosphate isomerase
MTDGGLAQDYLRKLSELAAEVANHMAADLEAVAEEVYRTLQNGGKLLFCGNGGSAADAQHLATEYVVRFRHDRRPLPALALTTDTSLLTAAANDLGFQSVFARQIEALGREGDLLFLHSTSGESENLVRAAEVAPSLGIQTIAFLAKGGGRLASMVDRCVVIPTDSTAHAQELQLACGHIICQLAETRFLEADE